MQGKVLNIISSHSNGLFSVFKRPFFSNEFKPDERIGPHNLDVISIIVGSLFGNTQLEKRKKGTRIVFDLCNDNVEYLMWLHKILASNGYCSSKKPKLSVRVAKNNKVMFNYCIKTYTFSSFN